MTRNARSRLLVPATLLAGLAACAINLDFDMPQTEQVDASGATAFMQVYAVDLSQQPAVQQHKDSVQSLGLNSADLSITSVNTNGGTNTVQTITGVFCLRADGAPADGSQDVLIGQLSNFRILPSTSLHLNGSPALDALLLAAVKGSGKFSVVVNVMHVEGGTEAHFVIQATLHAALGYNTGVF